MTATTRTDTLADLYTDAVARESLALDWYRLVEATVPNPYTSLGATEAQREWITARRVRQALEGVVAS